MIRSLTLLSLVALLLPFSSALAQTSSGPETGTVIEDFALNDQKGTQHKLSELLKQGPIALVVYRSADW